MAFLVELVPVELRQMFFVGGHVFVRQLQLGPAHRHEAVRHLAHVALEQADGNRRRVLEQVIDPGERIGVVGVGATPHRRTPSGVGHAHGGAALAAGSFGVAPVQVLQILDFPGDPINGSLFVGVEGDVDRSSPICCHLAELGVGSQQRSGLVVEPGDQVAQPLYVAFHPRQHERVDGRQHQVYHGLLAAAHAGAVAAHHRPVAALLEQHRWQHADALFQVGDVDVAIVCFGEVLPQSPVAP